MLQNKNLYGLVLLSLSAMAAIYLLSLRVLAEDDFVIEKQVSDLQIVEQTTLLPLCSPPPPQTASTITVVVTAYSSTVGETDETPFITASGEPVGNGIVANNVLPFGTKIRLPELFDDKVFVVKDRMHWKKGDDHIDIWFPSREAALAFGTKLTMMEVLNN